MSTVSPQNHTETDRATALSLPELPAPSQPETAEAVRPEVLSADYFGEVPEDQIAAEAYALYEARGYEDGHDIEDWLAAEALIRAKIEAGRRFSGSN